MQFTISRAALLRPLQLISGIVEKKQTLPILANVLVTVKERSLSVTATDLEVELIGRVTLEEDVPANSITVSARKLFDICRSLPEQAELKFSLEDKHLLVRSGKSRFSLATLPAADFPSVEEGIFTTQFSLSQNKLKKLLSKVYFAMGHQDVRHYLNGTLLDINQGLIKCVATDGHRLAMNSMSADHLKDAKKRVILPRKTVLELLHLLEGKEEAEAKIYLGDNHFRVVTDDFTFSSKLINAQYPDYDRLVPRNPQNIAVTDRETLKQALNRVAILCSEKFRGIRLQLEKDLLKVMANNPDQEEAEELVHLQYQGNPLEMGFNVAYLLDVLSTLASENIRWSFSDPNVGVIIESSDDEDESRYVVMPMRL